MVTKYTVFVWEWGDKTKEPGQGQPTGAIGRPGLSGKDPGS